MTNAWFLGATHSVPQTEDEVRSTVEPIRTDGENAEAQRDPEWNGFETDDSGELVGLSPRVKGAETTDVQKSVPTNIALATIDYTSPIDSQVATSGTAARREEAGQAGHGTMQYAESIEPVLRPGASYGNEFFDLIKPEVQDGAGDYMTITDTDGWDRAVAQSNAANASRRAYQGAQFNAFLNV